MDETKLDIENLKGRIEENDLDGIKVILNKYTPEQRKAMINKDTGVRGTFFNVSVVKGNIPIISYFIENGANVNYVYGKRSDKSSALADAKTLEVVKLLVENRATITAPPNLLHDSILHITHNIDILKYLITKRANVDAVNDDGTSVLHSHLDSLDILKVLLEARADPNIKDSMDKTALDDLVDLAGKDKTAIPKIKLLIAHKAKITPGIQDKINAGVLSEEVLNALSDPTIEVWKGWTQSDANALDSVFTAPADFSACPICLKYTVRQDGCIYMSHNCAGLGGLYNKKLYNMYKNDDGAIYWCTLCNRICLGHRHYKLSLYGIKAELGEPVNIHATDCRPYGGGYPEKVQRFNQLRAHALELNPSSRISAKSAFDELTEEFWNAPLRREKGKILGIIEKKAFGNATNFPPNLPTANVNNVNAPDIIPTTLIMPTLLQGFNSISMNDNVPVLQFHHENTGGLDHKDVLIGVKSLNDQLVELVKNFSDENFGRCIVYPDCKAKLYPQEIQPYVSHELYEKYKNKFNKRFKNGGRRTRKRRGGLSFFGEATNATCVLNGGTRKRKTKKSRKHR